MPDDEVTTLRVPTWLFRAVAIAAVMALFSLVGYFISDMKKDIDGKLNKSEYEIRMANVERQLQRLWERGRNQGTP